MTRFGRVTLTIVGMLAMSHASAIEDEVVAGCVACHKGALDLHGKRATDLTAIMQAMIDGSLTHVIPLPKLEPEEVQELAVLLAGGEDAAQ